jgi:hypothetical protein
MTEIIYYAPPFVHAADRFIKNSGIYTKEQIENWETQKRKETNLKNRIGLRGNQPQVIDREEKYNFVFKTKAHTKIPNMEYKEIKSFNELMIDRALELKGKDQYIQLFWSGGLDSTAALFALKEVCPDQIMVQTTPDAIAESPQMFEKYIKGDGIQYNIHVDNNLFSVADPDKYCVTTACCADQLYNTNIHGRLNEKNCNAKRFWRIRNRFSRSHRTFRWFLMTKKDKVNIDNIHPFYDCQNIEQHFINMVLDGRLTFTDKSAAGYKNHKPDIRNFVSHYDYDFGKNKLGRQDIRFSDETLMNAVNFNTGKKVSAPQWRIMAINTDGKVILRETLDIQAKLNRMSRDQYIEYGQKNIMPYLINLGD